MIARRLANTTVNSDTEFGLRALFMRFPENSSQSFIETKVDEALQIRTSVSTCDQFKEKAEELGTRQPAQPTRISLGDVNPRLREIIAGLPAGGISEPLIATIGIQMVMVCDREVTSDLPSRAEVRSNLVRERISVVSQRRLRDLRRSAYIDMRG
jgi:peptidyl-prolyl cis-trans isomerase SurA